MSLFSGYGTQELALKYSNVRYTTIANCDICVRANKVYDTIHNTEMGNLGDISTINENEFPDCDLLTYSFPCTDISVAGNQKGITEGTRSGLLLEVGRILTAKKPKYLLMENVKNLISKKHIDSFKTFIEFLKSIGYGNSYMVLNGADFGCPQNRERVFMFSVLGESEHSVEQKMLEVLKFKKDLVPMKDFLDDVDESFFINPPYVEYNKKFDNTNCKLVALRTDMKFDMRKRIYSVDKCSPCLDVVTGSPQIMLNDGRIRKISPREAYRFMGVKDTDIDKMLTSGITNNQHLALAGNSICVPVMESIFKVFFKEYIE